MGTRKDSRHRSKQSVNGEQLRAALTWAINEKVFAHLPLHGNTSWQFVDLLRLTLVWVWSPASTLTGAFAEAHRWSLQVLGRVPVQSFQGLLKALVTWSSTLLPLVAQQMQRLMEAHGGSHWRLGGWLPLAVDGSRVSTPRTAKNEQTLCAPNFGNSASAKHRRKKRRALGIRPRPKKSQPVRPQLWLTLFWHMGLQMPWCWKTGPSYASEREHFQTLLTQQRFPEKTLFCGDAGMTGYDLWSTILQAGHSFLIRVGGNVTLLRQLGYLRQRCGVVHFWPDQAARKQQPPLTLRLLQVKVGDRVMWLVTNVLDEKTLSEEDAVRLYRLRWGVELQFRTVKQTFGRGKLRSRTPERAYVELDWSLVGLWMIQLFAVKEQIRVGEIPERCSVGLAVQIIRTMLQRWSQRATLSFARQLRTATKDGYQRKRSKKARYRPDSKDKPAAGRPRILKATAHHKLLLKQHLNAAA